MPVFSGHTGVTNVELLIYFFLWGEGTISVIQYNLIITLSLGSIEVDRVISEPCYNEVTYYRHIAKLSIWEP